MLSLIPSTRTPDPGVWTRTRSTRVRLGRCARQCAPSAPSVRSPRLPGRRSGRHHAARAAFGRGAGRARAGVCGDLGSFGRGDDGEEGVRREGGRVLALSQRSADRCAVALRKLPRGSILRSRMVRRALYSMSRLRRSQKHAWRAGHKVLCKGLSLDRVESIVRLRVFDHPLICRPSLRTRSDPSPRETWRTVCARHDSRLLDSPRQCQISAAAAHVHRCSRDGLRTRPGSPQRDAHLRFADAHNRQTLSRHFGAARHIHGGLLRRYATRAQSQSPRHRAQRHAAGAKGRIQHRPVPVAPD